MMVVNDCSDKRYKADESYDHEKDVSVIIVTSYFLLFDLLWSFFFTGFSVFAASSCLLICGFCGLDFSRLAVIIYALICFDGAKLRLFPQISKDSPRYLSVCVSMSKSAFI